MEFLHHACMKRIGVKVLKKPNNSFLIQFPDGFSYECDEKHLKYYEEFTQKMKEFRITERPEPNRAPIATRFGVYDPKRDKKNLFRMNIKGLVEDPDMTPRIPISLDIIFGISVPKNANKKTRALMLSNKYKHTRAPDVDNLQKFLSDTLKNIAFADDGQVWEMYLRKEWAEQPFTDVKIRYWDDIDPDKKLI